MSQAFLLALLALSCAPAEQRKVEPYDEYVLVEFAAKLEEDQEKFENLQE